MSNKTQLQTNNTKYASLIETLRNKSLPTGGEDVTDETSAYTTKLSTLETAIAALETELQGKAGGSEGGSVETCTVSLVNNIGSIKWHYTDSDMTLQLITGTKDVVVPKNTIITYQEGNYGYGSLSTTGDCSPIFAGSINGFVAVYGSGTINFSIASGAD
jgi:hypothetical protein